MTIETLEGEQMRAFKDALMLAFPSYASMRAMAREGMGIRLQELVGEGPLADVAYELIEWAESEGRIEDLMTASIAAKPRNPKLLAFSYGVLLNAPAPPSERLQAIINANVPMLDTARWRADMERLESSVCRIEIPEGSAAGTGFVIAENLILTNCHVADLVGKRESLSQCVARFGYRREADGGDVAQDSAIRFAEDWLVDSSPVSQLDFAIIRLEGLLQSPPLPAPRQHSFAIGDFYFILHHPLGSAMKLSVGTFKSYDPRQKRVSYSANTEAGSSGSPVFTMDWSPVAIHRHAGGDANWGVSLAAIGETALAREVWKTQVPLAADEPVHVPLPPEEAPPAQAPPAAAADELAMKGLNRLADEDRTSPIVARYAPDLRRASACARAVGDVKLMHELVDQLRIAVYVPLSLAAGGLQSGALDRAISQAIRELSSLRGKLDDAASQPTFRKGEFPWLDEEGELAFAAEALDEAQAGSRPGALEDGLHYLRQPVENHLTTLDVRLGQASRGLDLPQLVAKLGALRADLDAAGIDVRRIRGLDEDIATLVEIKDRLEALVESHQAWQQVDAYLGQLENAVEQTADDVARGWRALQVPLRQACPEGSAERTAVMDQVIARLTAAIESRDMSAIRPSFDKLVNAFRNRLSQLDRQLLAECGKIRIIGESLSSVLEKIDA